MRVTNTIRDYIRKKEDLDKMLQALRDEIAG